MDLRNEEGFLGTNASLLADLNLMAYVLILLPLMAVGYLYARKKMFEPQHKLAMSTITLLNWVLIGIVMVSSFTDSVTPNISSDFDQDFIYVPTIHAIVGLGAQLLATYLVARMWLQNVLPESLLVKNIKLYMRITLSAWVFTAAFGILLYFTWYSDTEASDGGAPVVTEEPSEPDASDPAQTEEPSTDGSQPVETEEPAAESDATPTPDPTSAGEPVETEEPAANTAPQPSATLSPEPPAAQPTDVPSNDDPEPAITEEVSATE